MKASQEHIASYRLQAPLGKGANVDHTSQCDQLTRPSQGISHCRMVYDARDFDMTVKLLPVIR